MSGDTKVALAFVVLAAVIYMVPKLVDANRTINLAIALCTTDPLDAHFDSIPAECTPCDSPTFYHLRDDWGRWEQEVAG